MISARGTYWAVSLLAAVFAVAVIAGIVQRYPYIGALSDGHHQFLTADQTKFVEYWTQDGIWSDRFLTILSPFSIETRTIDQRGVYASFIPGGTVQIYLLHRLFATVPLVTLIAVYGIALQAIVAFFCGLIVWRSLAPADRHGLALFFVLAAMLTYLFQPAPYYFHPMVQFGYQAALVPFTVASWLELEIRRSRNPSVSRRLLWLQAVVLGWFAAVDWMFVPFCLALTLLRMASPLPTVGFIRSSVQIWLLPTLVCAAFVLNLHANGYLDLLLSRALLRTGLSTEAPLTAAAVYHRVFVERLSNTHLWLHAGLLASVIALASDRRDPVAVVSCLLMLACYLYVVLLPNDAYIHDFESLKFFVALAIVSFGIAPYRLIWSLQGGPRLAGLALMACLWTWYMADYHAEWRVWFQDRPPSTLELAQWLRANARFEQVYVSDDTAIPRETPVPVAIARKRVWLFPSAKDLDAYVAALPAGAVPRFVSKTDWHDCFAADSLVATLNDGTRIYTYWPGAVPCLERRWTAPRP